MSRRHGVYVSYPIDQDSSSQAANVISLTRWLRSRVSWVFDPGMAFTVGPEITPDVRAINMTALDRASIVVAFAPRGIPTIGVPMEIERAVAAGKQVLVVSDAPSWMLEFDVPNAEVVYSWGETARLALAEMIETPVSGLPWGTGAPESPSRSRLPVVVSEGAEAPRRGYGDDAGLDLVVSETIDIPGRGFVDIPCGVTIELPDWSWGMITGRSSTLRNRGLLVTQGIIDAGYRGPLFAGVQNLSDETKVVSKGERIAQLLVMVNGTRLVDVEETDSLNPGSRGNAGFGSTGR